MDTDFTDVDLIPTRATQIEVTVETVSATGIPGWLRFKDSGFSIDFAESPSPDKVKTTDAWRAVLDDGTLTLTTHGIHADQTATRFVIAVPEQALIPFSVRTRSGDVTIEGGNQGATVRRKKEMFGPQNKRYRLE